MPSQKNVKQLKAKFAAAKRDKKKVSESDIAEPLVDAETFMSETDQFYSSKISELKEKAGKNKKDDDRYLIRPLIGEIEEQDEDDDEDNQNKETTLETNHFKETVHNVTRKPKDESDNEEDEAPLKLKGAWSDEEDSDEEKEERKKKKESKHLSTWKKSEYFEQHNDKITTRSRNDKERGDFDDEEEEARRLQRERAKRLSMSDYLDEFMLDDEKDTKKDEQDEDIIVENNNGISKIQMDSIDEEEDDDEDENEEDVAIMSEDEEVIELPKKKSNNTKVNDKKLTNKKKEEKKSKDFERLEEILNKDKKRKRSSIQDDLDSKKLKRDEEDEILMQGIRTNSSGKRKASYSILENKGLMARSKKDARNSRIRHKNKYKNKTGGLRFGKVKEYRGNYSGENRISSNVVKSRKIKT